MKKHGLLWLAPVLMLAAFFAGCANDDGGSVDEGITGSVIMPKDSTSFRVSPARISLAKGTKQQFKAYYNGKEVSLVEWAVSGSAGSSKFGTDNISTSELEVSLNETAGVLNVSATLTSNGKKFTAQALVTVLGNGDVPLEHGLTVSPGVVVVGKGFSQTFTASLSTSGVAASGVSWTVSGGGSGTGITSGILTVAAGETAEKLLVTASLNADKYGTAIVYVGSAPEGSGPFPENHGIEVKLPNVTLDKGEQGSFTALGTNLGSVTWSLAGNKVATTITAGTFTVAQAETAEKIAVKAASGEKRGQAVVTVRGNDGPPPYGPVVDGLLLEPEEVSVAKGGTQTFTVKVYVGDVSWTVRGGKSGTAVSGGVLTVASGETAKYLVVRAEASDGKNGTAVVTVTESGGGSDSGGGSGSGSGGGSGGGSGSGSEEASPTAVTLNRVTADGVKNTTTTTELTLEFDEDISGLSKDNITLDPELTKGTLQGPYANHKYKLPVTVTASGNISVTVSKEGYEIGGNPKQVGVYYATPAQLKTVTANGGSTETTTELTLEFDKNISNLAATDITLDPTLTKGTLTGPDSSHKYKLPVTVKVAGTLNVSVSKSGYEISGSPKTVEVKYIPTLVNADSTSIKTKFGIETTGTTGVTDMFNTLSAFISGGGLSSHPNAIKLGDYIDLEAGLSVTAYGSGDNTGGFSISAADGLKAITTTARYTYNPNYSGALLRIIVVGINSFKGKNGNSRDHVVFQFQNIPVLRRMNASDTTSGGYAASEMREYLTPVNGKTGSGKFLEGLTEAGVPEAVLWAPKRFMAIGMENGRTTTQIEDKLWLPTEREMYGMNDFSNGFAETAENQAQLDYYYNENTSPYSRRIKYNSSNLDFYGIPTSLDGIGGSYWEASIAGNPGSGNPDFCKVASHGYALSQHVTTAAGVAPAFCVAY